MSVISPYTPHGVAPILCTSTLQGVLNLSGASQTIFSASNTRKRVIITNNSAANAAWIAFGVASVVNNGLRIGPGQTWDSVTGPLPNTTITAIGTAGQTLGVMELS